MADSAAIDRGAAVHVEREIDNTDRAVGATLSNAVSEAHRDGLPNGTITADLYGTAGQSFGAFLQSGITLNLTGTANDYVGKGLSGGRLTITTPSRAGYEADANVVVGNVALYGATQGECYVNGVAGERFAVRNSGVRAVVEDVGDHGCEYMTGGAVAVLGDTGRNFAAGMSGGVAYVHDPDGDFADHANTEMVTLYDALDPKDERLLRRLVENHAAYTGSDRAAALLDDWDTARDHFVKVMPDAYADVIENEGRADVRDEPPAPAASADSTTATATGDD
jgi:glutamate synthase (NADPH/NADH) large chain